MKHNRKILTVIAVLFALGIPCHAEEKPLKVFIFIGTSNMKGFGAVIGKLPADLKQPSDNVQYYYTKENKWGPFNGNWKQPGPEHSFAQALTKQLGEPVGIIKDTKDFLPPDMMKMSESLNDAWSPENANGRYPHLLQLIKAAGVAKNIVVAGICWDQSGRDTIKQADADAYQKNLIHLIESLRKELNNPTLPFVCALENTHPGTPLEKFPCYEEVRKAQTAMNLPAFRTFDQNDLPRVMDTAKPEDKAGIHNDHLTTEGEVESGKRYAAAMIDILTKGK